MSTATSTHDNTIPDQLVLDCPFDLSIVPGNMKVDDAPSQSIALEAVLLSQKADEDEDARFFEQPVLSTSLNYFKRIYERNDRVAAIKLLTRHLRVDFDKPEFVTPSNSQDITWNVERNFIDMLVFVGKDIGLGAMLPNQRVNSFYTVKVMFTQKKKEFKAKNIKLGFDPAGSMLWIGHMPSSDDIWIAWIPKTEVQPGKKKSSASTCLSERHYRITVMFFAFVLNKIAFRDIVVHDPYPDLSDELSFKSATNLL